MKAVVSLEGCRSSNQRLQCELEDSAAQYFSLADELRNKNGLAKNGILRQRECGSIIEGLRRNEIAFQERNQNFQKENDRLNDDILNVGGKDVDFGEEKEIKDLKEENQALSTYLALNLTNRDATAASSSASSKAIE